MAEKKLTRALDALARRAGDTAAKICGREPYLEWNDLLADWVQGFRVLATAARLDELSEEVPAFAAPCAIEESSETGYVRVRLNGGEVLCWPSDYDTAVLGQVEWELSTGHPHNYFDLYEPIPGDVVFDVGSCEGLFAYRALDRGARVYAFEPLDQLERALELTFADEIEADLLRVYALAFGDASGDITLMVNDARPECTTGDLDLAGYADKSGFRPMRMQVDTIDAFVAREGIQQLDCIKLDIESAEMAALLGAKVTLETMRPNVLVALYHRPEDVRVIPAFLQGLGYTILPGALTYYPGVRLTSRSDTPRPHYRPHVILASYPEAKTGSSNCRSTQQWALEGENDHG